MLEKMLVKTGYREGERRGVCHCIPVIIVRCCHFFDLEKKKETPRYF